MRTDANHRSGLSRQRRGHLLLAFALSVTAVLGLSAAPAQASKTHLFLEEFGSAVHPSFTRATAIALDPATGTLLVADSQEEETDTGTIRRFNLDGTPADFSALGTNAIDGKVVGDQTPQDGLTFGVFG